MYNFSINVFSYNTHLFGGLVDDGSWFTGYKDDDRHKQLKAYLSQSDRPADIIGLQEVWSGAIANDLEHDLQSIFPGFYARDPHHGDFNRSGLCLMTCQGISMSNQNKFDYISNCDVDGFADQDKVPVLWETEHITSKGFLFAQLELSSDFDNAIPDGESVTLGLFTTHMPTNPSTYPESINACFSALANAVKTFIDDNPSAGVLVVGDLNTLAPGSVPYKENRQHEYETYVQGILGNTAGLNDAYSLAGQDGCTVVGATNLLWQHFNKDATAPYPAERIDYIFFRNSSDGKVSINVSSAEVVIDNMLRVGDESGGLDVSDHYPIFAQISLSIND